MIGSADEIPYCQSAATVIIFWSFGIQVLLRIKCAEVDKARSLSITPSGQMVNRKEIYTFYRQVLHFCHVENRLEALLADEKGTDGAGVMT